MFNVSHFLVFSFVGLCIDWFIYFGFLLSFTFPCHWCALLSFFVFVVVWCCSLICIVVVGLLLIVGHWCSLLQCIIVTPWNFIVRHRYFSLSFISTTPQLFIARHCYCLLPSIVVVPHFSLLCVVVVLPCNSLTFLSFLGSLLICITIVPFYLSSLIPSIWYYPNPCFFASEGKETKKTQTSSSIFLKQVLKILLCLFLFFIVFICVLWTCVCLDFFRLSIIENYILDFLNELSIKVN